MKEIEKFLKELEEINKEIIEILNMAPSILEKKIKNWSIKDAIAHIISWKREILEIMKKTQEGKFKWNYFLKTQKDIDEWNEREINKRKNFSALELKEELEKVSNELILFLKTLDEKMLKKEFEPPWEGKTTIFECIEAQIEHSREHLEKIKKLKLYD
ncbi:MAG: DinB family protein [Candidatus Hydrothermales bacterium]